MGSQAASPFRPPSSFHRKTPYHLLPFRFTDFDRDHRLLVNDVGEYLVLEHPTFAAFVAGRLTPESGAYADLKAKHFLTDSNSVVPLRLLALKHRTKRGFLEGFTKLHMIVVTLRCEHSCPYCQVSRVTQDRARYDMTEETATKSLAFVFRAPADPLKIEFQGGEPLLAFPRIKQIVVAARDRADREGRRVEIVVATNLALLTDEILEFFRTHDVFVSTSLDGPADLHNENRPRPGGNSHALVVANIARARAALGEDRVSALMTTTRASLGQPEAIVDEYLERGFRSIFLRPMSRYGFAARGRARLTYPMDEFLEFYDRALDHILALNASGISFSETYAQIVLAKILTPFGTGYVDLQSPAGVGIGGVIYNYDGVVYASDEGRMLAEMGDRRFALGTVDEPWESVFCGDRLRRIIRDSVVETLPGCSDCAFQPYCGADPVHNHAVYGDIVGRRPGSDFHVKNEHIMRRLLWLYETDERARATLSSWVPSPAESVEADHP